MENLPRQTNKRNNDNKCIFLSKINQQFKVPMILMLNNNKIIKYDIKFYQIKIACKVIYIIDNISFKKNIYYR